LRLSAARNLRHAGVDEDVAMRVLGHKTTSTFRRYRIQDARDMIAAAEKMDAFFAAQPKGKKKVGTVRQFAPPQQSRSSAR
jgi:hypothetical protein